MKKLILYSCISFNCFFSLFLNVNAQQVQRQIAISAYIYNFAKNIEWQNEASLKEFNFLIIGQDDKIIQEMRNMAKSKTIREKPIRVTTAAALTDINNVQLIFLLKGEEESLVKVFDRIEGKNILLVTESYLNKKLFMINFFDSGKGTLQFEINKANILNQHLRIMQDMILLGGTEIDVATLYREGQQSLRSLQKHSDDLEKNSSQLEANLKQLEKTIAIRNKEIQDSKDSLKQQSFKILDQQKILDSQSAKLRQSEQELADQMLKIQEQQAIFALQTKNLESQKTEFEKGNNLLQDQKEDISRQKDEITAQTKILEEQGTKIHKQQNLVYLLAIIILLVIVLVFSIYIGYKSKQKLNRELEIKVTERTADLDTSNKQLMIELSERKLAQKKLMESENKYRTLLENLPQKIFFKDNELVFVSCNENFARELQISAADIQGKTDYDFFPKELAEKYRKEDSDFLKSGKPMETEECTIRDGQAYWTQLIKIPVKDESGVIIGVQGIFKDITDRKLDEEKLKKINEELMLSNSELMILNKVIVESSGQLDVKSLMALTMDEALNLTGLEGGTVCSVTKDNRLHLVIERNTSEVTKYDLQENVIQVGDCLCGNCALDKKPLILKNREEVLKYSSREVLRDQDIRFHAAFPIISKGESTGVLCVFSHTDKKPTERSLKLVETLTSQMSLSIENASLYEKISNHVENLENLVKDRTMDLETKNMELARMNKMFVGREIRMAELKRQVAELENKNDSI